jgi:hypothetical protein
MGLPEPFHRTHRCGSPSPGPNTWSSGMVGRDLPPTSGTREIRTVRALCQL